MNTEQKLGVLPKKVLKRVESGELNITRANGVQCITIPLDEYMTLLECRVALKARKKK